MSHRLEEGMSLQGHLLGNRLVETGYRLRWAHEPSPFGRMGNRLMLGAEHESLWWAAESMRHGANGATNDLLAFYADGAADHAASQCPSSSSSPPSPPPPPATEKYLRNLKALRALHDVQAQWGELLSVQLELTMELSLYHVSLLMLADAVAQPDPSGMIVRSAYNRVMSTHVFVNALRYELVGARSGLIAQLASSALRDALRLNQAALLGAEMAAFGPVWPLAPATAFEHLSYVGLTESNPYLLPPQIQQEAASRASARRAAEQSTRAEQPPGPASAAEDRSQCRLRTRRARLLCRAIQVARAAHASSAADELTLRTEEEKEIVRVASGPQAFAHSWNPLLWEAPAQRTPASYLDAITRIPEPDEDVKALRDSISDNLLISRGYATRGVSSAIGAGAMLRKELKVGGTSGDDSSAGDSEAASKTYTEALARMAKLHSSWMSARALTLYGRGYLIQAESGTIGLLRLQAERSNATVGGASAPAKGPAGLAQGPFFERTRKAAEWLAATTTPRAATPWRHAMFGLASPAPSNISAAEPPKTPATPASTEAGALGLLAQYRFYGCVHVGTQSSLHAVISAQLGLFEALVALQSALHPPASAASQQQSCERSSHVRKAQWGLYAAYLRMLSARSTYGSNRAYFFSGALELRGAFDEEAMDDDDLIPVDDDIPADAESQRVSMLKANGTFYTFGQTEDAPPSPEEQAFGEQEAAAGREERRKAEQAAGRSAGLPPGMGLDPRVLKTLSYAKEVETRRFGAWHPLHPTWLSEAYRAPAQRLGWSYNPLLWPDAW